MPDDDDVICICDAYRADLQPGKCNIHAKPKASLAEIKQRIVDDILEGRYPRPLESFHDLDFDTRSLFSSYIKDEQVRFQPQADLLEAWLGTLHHLWTPPVEEGTLEWLNTLPVGTKVLDKDGDRWRKIPGEGMGQKWNGRGEMEYVPTGTWAYLDSPGHGSPRNYWEPYTVVTNE